MRTVLLTIAAACVLQAEVKLPALISDHMLIQRDVPVRIWGKSSPGEAVKVEFHGQTLESKGDAAGNWQVFLAPTGGGGPYELGINGTTIHDVLVGEVWVGSGQSNMEFPMARVNNADTEIAAAHFPSIRLFTVKRVVAGEPVDDVQGSWSECTPVSVKNFSAVEYFFGKEIYETLHVNVGLIHSSWGGTPAQAWTEKSYLKNDLNLQTYLTGWDKVLSDYPQKKEAYDKTALPHWEQQVAMAKTAGTKPPNKPGEPAGPGSPNTPSGLYNAMIAPLTPYAIRGAVWYQGEANANQNESELYRRLFPAMIESWRKEWGQGSFPFYFVQLANFRTNGWWPLLRESQTETLELANTGQALAIDVGNPTDIHPTDKQTVGHRLALIARAQTYGEKIVYSGPAYRQMTTEGASARIWFDWAGAGLDARGGGDLKGFWIAGADRKFFPGTAKIDGGGVVVSSPDVPEPKAVRYAWSDDPAANLYNRDGLPAVPFRTDSWEKATALK